MIPYVEFNYEWRQKQSEPKHVSAQLNQTAAPFKYLSFFAMGKPISNLVTSMLCVSRKIFLGERRISETFGDKSIIPTRYN